MSRKNPTPTKSWLARMRVAIASFALAGAMVSGVAAAPEPEAVTDETAQRTTLYYSVDKGPITQARSITWS